MKAEFNTLHSVQNVAFTEFEDIYKQYHKAVYANICKVVKDAALAEDVFQDVFLTLWEHLTTKPAKQSLAAWLFVVSHNKAKACLRKEIKDSLLFVDDYGFLHNTQDPANDETTIAEQQLQMIQQAVQRLSPRRKQVFILNKLEGKSVDEIAAQMSTTPGTVKEYLKQSVRMVRDQIMNEKGYAESTALLLWMIYSAN